MVFASWNNLLRIVLVGPLAYVALVLLVRWSGKRTLSNLVVTVALGSPLSSTLLDSKVALADGLIAFGVLIGLLTRWATHRRSFSFCRPSRVACSMAMTW